jgi:tetratricopeptide (TPR) repeat protein
MTEILQKNQKPFLSLCMIVKNEEKNLPRCLDSAKPYVDEIVIVDTGSEDRTVEIAASYGAKVAYFQWCNDFAAARNYALSLVSGEWILVLDADEELIVQPIDKPSQIKEQLLAQPAIQAYYLNRTEANDTDGLVPLLTVRLFRNLAGLKFTGRFHEKLQYQNQDLVESQLGYFDDLTILHYGYGTEQVQHKNIARNIPILEAARQTEGLSLTLLYCLAGMYRDTQQAEKAQDCYDEAIERLIPYLESGNRPEEFRFIPSLVFTLAAQSLQQQDYETTRVLCQRGLEWCPNYPPLNYLTGCLLRALGFPLGAIAYFEYCLEMGEANSYYEYEPFEAEFLTIFPAYDLGKTHVQTGNHDAAIAAFELALTFNPDFAAAQESIEQIKNR